MKKIIFLLILLVSIIFINGCKKDPVSSPLPVEDFSYPPSSKFAITVYSEQTIIKKGDIIDIKLVFYNIPSVFGTALELNYPNNLIEFTDDSKMLLGQFFQIGDSALVLKKVEQLQGRASVGISYIKGSGLTANSSGVVFKLKGEAIASGIAEISINKNKLKILKSDGTPVNNFSGLLVENLSLNIQL